MDKKKSRPNKKQILTSFTYLSKSHLFLLHLNSFFFLVGYFEKITIKMTLYYVLEEEEDGEEEK